MSTNTGQSESKKANFNTSYLVEKRHYVVRRGRLNETDFVDKWQFRTAPKLWFQEEFSWSLPLGSQYECVSPYTAVVLPTQGQLSFTLAGKDWDESKNSHTFETLGGERERRSFLSASFPFPPNSCRFLVPVYRCFFSYKTLTQFSTTFHPSRFPEHWKSHSRSQSRLSLLAGKAWGTMNKWFCPELIGQTLNKRNLNLANQINRFKIALL